MNQENVLDDVNQACAAWGVLGLAIAIAKDGKVVFAKGYGARKLADHAPFNEPWTSAREAKSD